jgi:hypothetical protein
MKAIVIINYIESTLFRSFKTHAKQYKAVGSPRNQRELTIYDYSEEDEEKILLCVSQKSSQPKRTIDRTLGSGVDRIVFGHRNNVEGGRLPHISFSNSQGDGVFEYLQGLAEGRISFDCLFKNHTEKFASETAVPILSLFLPIDVELQALSLWVQSFFSENGTGETGREGNKESNSVRESVPCAADSDFISRLKKGLLRVEGIYRGRNRAQLLGHLEDHKVQEVLNCYGRMCQLLLSEDEICWAKEEELIENVIQRCHYFHEWYIRLANLTRCMES